MSLDWVTDGITAVNEQERPRQKVIPSRYPFTYAYDYIRSHPEFIAQAPHQALSAPRSRGEAATWLRAQTGTGGSTDPRYVAVCRLIADAAIADLGAVPGVGAVRLHDRPGGDRRVGGDVVGPDLSTMRDAAEGIA